ncbi:thiamine pyrophosphate-dependent dehydrogenase E1 component subunit alpha [Viridibacterium curvum]|uniref:Thiamine pyrophosphate-dependent dehydrogenase E1 component subunit alpha n=2 Tax=Viridibacterium curvum TaxID=1101404 RepID=A0ABP9QLB5_9RHOO
MDKALSVRLLRDMLLIRKVEEGIAERYPQGKMRCPTHLSIGQEAAAVAVGAALETADLAISTHRAHAHYLAKGGRAPQMLAEIYGKVTGCCRGRGGSMHLTDRTAGFVGSTAIVGNSLPIGTGLALSLQLKKSRQIAAIFFGDGCTEEGAFYESANFAIVRNLPALFVCENNLYSVYSPLSVRQPAGREIYKMVQGLGMPSAIVDGNDIDAAYAAAMAAIEHVRSGKGPFFLELTTYRWREHCGPNFDNDIGYRTEEEFLAWKARDPVASYEARLQQQGVPTEELAALHTQLDAEVLAAFEFAETSPFPDQSEAFSDVYTDKEVSPS